ncbi:probable RNA polymerase II nuclear localization protein SLC7A6OS isoform X4 [Dermochelys coriacea]|uniref:probable RNA polymerase II nuclear localization protein SLC7A6OS isoform X4 n=1 Tax=Dermochelys coriacea TaxID=27794 RepID=UPI0018E8398B|nr:probable RNA polymerase II nuclear localization protein SLC7A6OS isoform X4 [Dermochelys coriacea]
MLRGLAAGMERAAVLRVKRKRGGSEPAEALVIACKRQRTEPEPARDPVEKSLFKLVATVSSQNESVQKYVQEAITRDKAAEILRPSLGSTQRIIQDLRSSKQVKRQENRYRILTSHRPNCAEKETIALGTNGEETNEGAKLDPEEKKNTSQQGSTAAYGSSSYFGEFQLFDVVQEEEVERDPTISAADTEVDDDDDDISEEIYDDEDDENNENNWRNDYPDEDEFLPEEDEDREGRDGESEDGNFSEEDGRSIRSRTWVKYHCDILKEFEYDGVQDLNSD